MAEKRYFPGCASFLAALSEYLRQRFEHEGYEVQLMDDQDVRHPGRTFQMRQRYSEGWIKKVSTYTGLDTAATVVMKRVGEDLDVELGGAKWLDKAAVAGVGVVTSLGLLLVPAGIGAWKQRQLLVDLEQAVDHFFRNRERLTPE